MPTASILWDKIEHITASLRSELALPGEDLKAYINTWIEGVVHDLSHSADFSVDDYDPPKYEDYGSDTGGSGGYGSNMTLEDAVSSHKQRTQAYEESINNIIQSIALDTSDIANVSHSH